MYGIQYSITHKLDRPINKHNIVFVSYAGIGGEIKRSLDDHTPERNTIVINLSVNMANVNTLALNPDHCASGIDKRLLTAIKDEYECKLRQQVLFNEDKSLSVEGLKFDEKRRNSVEDICDMDLYTANPVHLKVRVSFTRQDLAELSERNELFSDILAVIIEFPEACYSEKYRTMNGALRSLNQQRELRLAELRKRNEIFAENGNVYNYFLNDPERRVGTLYVNHLGTVRKIKGVTLNYLKKGLYLSFGEAEEYEERIIPIDDVIKGEAIGLGIYLTEAQAKTGTNNNEENVRLTKELDKLGTVLKERGRDLSKVTDRAVKAEELNVTMSTDMKLLKHELTMKELLLKEREQSLKIKEELIKFKEIEQKHKEDTDDSMLGRAKRFLGGMADVGRSVFGFIDGASKAKMGAKLLGIF